MAKTNPACRISTSLSTNPTDIESVYKFVKKAVLEARNAWLSLERILTSYHSEGSFQMYIYKG